jgi:hypothetical protein
MIPNAKRSGIVVAVAALLTMGTAPIAAIDAAEVEQHRASLVAQCHDLRGQMRAASGDLAGGANAFRQAGDRMKDLLESMSDDDRRSFVHHPAWRTAITNLIDTLTQIGEREEALGYLMPLGVGTCEVEPRRSAPVAEPVG